MVTRGKVSIHAGHVSCSGRPLRAGRPSTKKLKKGLNLGTTHSSDSLNKTKNGKKFPRFNQKYCQPPPLSHACCCMTVRHGAFFVTVFRTTISVAVIILVLTNLFLEDVIVSEPMK